MAQIDFSSAYRDSTKGSTLKALQLRQKELAEQQAIQMRPRQIDAPSQGWAQIAGVVSSGIQEGRAAAQEQAGRQRFAELLSGGLTPEEMGEAVALDPDIAMKYQEHTWQSEADKAAADAEKQRDLMKHGWDTEAATARVQAEREQQDRLFGHQDASAEELAREQEKAKQLEDERKVEAARIENQAKIDAAAKAAGVQEEQTRLGAALGSDEAKLAEGLKQGTISQEAYDQGMESIKLKRAKEAMSPGQQTTDQDFAKEANDWKQQGAAQVTSNVANVKQALTILNQPGILGPTGRIMGVAEKVLPEWGMQFINPQGVVAQDSIRSAVQSSLKAVLGTQFAAVEGEQLLKRAFSMGLSPQENIRRAGLIMDQIAETAKRKQAMVDYFDTHNKSMAGYEGPGLDTRTLEDMDFGDTGTGGDTGGGGTGPQEGDTATGPNGQKAVFKNGQWVVQ